MNKLLGLLSVGTLSVLFAATAPGCDSVDEAFDCHDICTKYRDCADANYNVDACENRCRDNADDDEDFSDAADDCQACIDDRSCVGAAFSCAAECAAVVP